MSLFADYGLDARLLKTLEKINYQTPTPIQQMAIPLVLQDEDLFATAQTGTGKTGAFLIPLLHRMAQTERAPKGKPRALVLAPTRELAVQIGDEAKKFSRNLDGFKTAVVYGGVPYPVQRKSLSRGCDLVVATPGRLIDLLNQKAIDLSFVDYFVLDEADRMLDMGFIGPVETIAERVSPDRQTLLFSATMNQKVLKLSASLQIKPKEIAVKPDISHNPKIEQRLYFTDDSQHKIALLEHFLNHEEQEQMIVFTSTKRQAEALAKHLKGQNFLTAPLHGDIPQRKRTKTIDKVRKGIVKVLVATDVAARGIDVPTISHVINFDLPTQAEDFVHRIGRTGRAGSSGIAISLCSERDRKLLREIGELTGEKIPACTIPGLEPKEKAKRPKREFNRFKQREAPRQKRKFFGRRGRKPQPQS